MSKQLLKIDGLSVNVEDKEILHGINLEIKKGETHVLMGPNGAGKSTLGYALMGNPRYEVTKGDIWFQGKRINEEPADKRAKAGMFLSFQNPGAVGDNQKTSVPALLVLFHALGHGSYRIHVQTGIRLIQYDQTGI